MRKTTSWIAGAMACTLATGAAAEIRLNVDAGRVAGPVDEKIYGHFLEHIYHSCNGGLWGELIWDRSFEGTGGGIAWTAEDGMIAQDGLAPDVRLTFGSADWTDYELTVEARKTGGDEGFLILVRALNADAFYWANLGGWGNAGHALERGIDDGRRWHAVTPRRDGRIETDRWYRIRARCEGPHIRVWLDDDLVVDYTDDGRGATRGKAGVGTWNTRAQFRNIKVSSLDGKTLYDALPPVPDDGPPAAPGWRKVGSAKVAATTENPFNGATCMRVETDGDPGGLAQEPMKLEAGEVYRGSIRVCGEAPDGLVVRMLDGEKVLARQVLAAPSAEWREFPLELIPDASADNGALRIELRGKGTVRLDQVSLMPESWRKAGGCRPDLLQAIADLKPPVIRWPGGCFASPYRWKDGIGPQETRRPHPLTMWDDRDVNSFGTDEYIAMCRRVGAEPLIVVNIGTPAWNRSAGDHDFLQEVLDWIEYCNGPSDSTWGKVRAANGHPEPYGVKYWEIDNETWGMGAETYAEWVNRFAPAMRRADPTIKLAACGSAGYGEGGNGLAWNRVLIEKCADKVDYLSIHHYEDPNRFAEGPLAYEAFFRKTGDLIAKSANPDLKIYVSEWNAQSTDWRTGLYCGGLLNAFERCGDILEIGGPALFLRHVSATAWDNAFVNFSHAGWFPAPNYVVMKLYRDHYTPLRLDVSGDPDGLNVVAGKSADGSRVVLKLVNPTDTPAELRVAISGGFVPKTATLTLVAADALTARNTPERPDAIRAVPGEVACAPDGVRFAVPARSVAVVEAGK